MITETEIRYMLRSADIEADQWQVEILCMLLNTKGRIDTSMDRRSRL